MGGRAKRGLTGGWGEGWPGMQGGSVGVHQDESHVLLLLVLKLTVRNSPLVLEIFSKYAVRNFQPPYRPEPFSRRNRVVGFVEREHRQGAERASDKPHSASPCREYTPSLQSGSHRVYSAGLVGSKALLPSSPPKHALVALP